MAVPSKYNQEYHDDWAWSLAIKGATDKEIAEAFGIAVRTLHRWKQAYESLTLALMSGKEAADAKVERKLFERATGYKYEETETVMEIDANGNRKPAKVKKVQKECPPDVLAQMYWLNNRKPKQYKRNPESFISQDNDDVDEVVFYLPDNGRSADNEEG